jgi:chromosome segregation ATPase
MSAETEQTAFDAFLAELSDMPPTRIEIIADRIKTDLERVNDRIVELTEEVRPIRKQYAEMRSAVEKHGVTPALRRLHGKLEEAKQELAELNASRLFFLQQLLNLDVRPPTTNHTENT